MIQNGPDKSRISISFCDLFEDFPWFTNGKLVISNLRKITTNTSFTMPESAQSVSAIPVYMMPGMAANPSIFENIRLPSERFQVFWLEWKLPQKDESLKDYARRMTEEIKHDDPVLIGVSFGGILVQEIASIISVRKVIIISSVKTRKELPFHMRVARKTSLHKLLPTSLVSHVELLQRYAVGEPVTRRLALYEKYLSVRDKDYLDWSIHQVVNWKREEVLPGLLHIHGDRDAVFPAYRIRKCIWVKGGTHVMIVNRFRWFNEHLPEFIEGE